MSRPGARRRARRPGGFSLAELLIVLAIAAILASLALPAYGSYIARSRRVAARVALYQAAHWMERAATAGGRYPDASAIAQSLSPVPGGHYRLQAIEAGPTTFTLAATPVGAQADDRCGTLLLSQSGQRQISHAPDATATADTCWSR